MATTVKSIEAVTIGQITQAAKQSSLNAACNYLQELIGQEDGGIAGIVFSGGEDEDWFRYSTPDRAKMLTYYLLVELNYASIQKPSFKQHHIILPEVFEEKYYEFDELGADRQFVKCVHWYDNNYWIVEWHTPPQQMSGKFWTMNDGGDKSSDDLSELEEWLYNSVN